MSDHQQTHDLVKRGIAAFKARHRQQATMLFEQALAHDPDNQLALLWLSGCTNDPDQKRAYLQRVVAINPNNEAGKRAASGLTHLESQPALLQSSPPTQPAAAPTPPGKPQPQAVTPLQKRLAGAQTAARKSNMDDLRATLTNEFLADDQADLREPDLTATPFVLHPENRAFAEGRARFPSGRKEYRAWLLVTSMFLLVSIGMGIFAAMLWMESLTLAYRGVETEGEIIARRTVEGSEGNHFYVQYQFETVHTDEQRQTYTNDHPVTAEAYAQLQPETSATVRYLPDDPQVSQMDGYHNEARNAFTILSISWSVFFLPVLAFFVVVHRRERRLMRQGRVVRGQVLACDGQMDREDGFTITLQYRFGGPETHDRCITDSASLVRHDLHKKPLPPRGTPVLVWYLNEDTYDVL
jgi:tetratricopeptide (TPR) repeat protein